MFFLTNTVIFCALISLFEEKKSNNAITNVFLVNVFSLVDIKALYR